METSQNTLARFAGLLYLVLIPTAAPGILSGQMAVKATAVETLAGIADGRTTFALTTLLGVIGFIDFLLLAMVLHRLFRSYCRPAADVMLAFVAVSIPLSLEAMALRLDMLNLLDAAGGVPELVSPALETQFSLTLARSNNLMQVAVIFWGLWLLPLAQLCRVSGFVPRILSIFLTIGGLFYVVSFSVYVFNAEFQSSTSGVVFSSIGGLSAMLGEIGLAFWLVIKGTTWRQ